MGFLQTLGNIAGGVERQLNPFDGGATYSNPNPQLQNRPQPAPARTPAPVQQRGSLQVARTPAPVVNRAQPLQVQRAQPLNVQPLRLPQFNQPSPVQLPQQPLQVHTATQQPLHVGNQTIQPSQQARTAPSIQPAQPSLINQFVNANKQLASPVLHQAQHVAQLPGRGFVNAANAIPTLPNTNPVGRFVNNTVINPVKQTDTHIGQLAQGHNPYTGNTKQKLGQIGQALLNVAQVVPIGKGAELAAKSVPLLTKAGQGVKLGLKAGGGFGAGQGLTDSLKNNDNFGNTVRNIVNTADTGALAGGILGGVAPLAAGVIGKGASSAGKAFNNRVPLNDAGAIKLPSFNGIKNGLKSANDKAFSTPQIRTNVADQNALRAYSDHLGGVKLADQATMQTAMNAAAKHGVDITSGPVATRQANVNSILDNLGKSNKAVSQGGYAKVPGGAKDPAPDLHPDQKNFINEYANMLKDMGQGNGVAINPETGARISNNVRDASLGKGNVSQAQWFDHARQELESGKGAYGASDEYKQIAGKPPLDIPKGFDVPSANVAATKPTLPQSPTVKTPKVTAGLANDASLVNGNKLSRNANVTVQNSDKITPLVKQLTKTNETQYTPAVIKDGQAAASEFVKNPSAQSAVQNTLDTKLGHINFQDVLNAHAVVQKLQASANPEDHIAAANILSKLSEHHTAAGQQLSAASALAGKSPLGKVAAAQRLIENGGKGGAKQQITADVATKLNGHQQALTQADTNLKQAISNHEANIAQSEKQFAATGKHNNAATATSYKAIQDAQTASLRAHDNLQKFVSENIHHSVGSKAFALWRTGLLSGPKTVSKILVSHAFIGGLEQAKQLPATALDMGISGVSRALGHGGMRSTSASLRGGKEFVRGLKASGDLLLHGKDTAGTGGYSGTIAGTLTHSNVSFKGTKLDKLTHGASGKALDFYTTKIGQVHASVPKAFFTAAQARDLANQAIASGRNLNLRGTQLTDHVNHFINSASDAARKEAEHSGQFAAFQQANATTKLGKAIQNLPGGKVIMPFAHIASTIVSDAAHYSPAALGIAGHDVVKSLRAGGGWTPAIQKKFVEEIGRGITGTGIGVIGYELAKKGLMTGGYPADPAERKLWDAQGKTPNSILISGKWRSTSTLEPAGSLLAAGHAVYESGQTNGKGKSQLLPAITGLGQDLTSQSYLSGITGLSDAIAHPTQYGAKFAKQQIGSVVPVGVAQVATATDPLQRNTKGVLDSVKAKIPGVRETLTPKTGVYGNDLGRQPGPGIGGALQNLLDPSRPSTAITNDKTINELQRLKDATGSTSVPSTVTSINAKDASGNKVVVPLGTQQQHDYNATTGQQIKTAADAIIKDPNYQKLTDANKVKALNASQKNIQTLNKAATVKDTNSGDTVKLTKDQQNGTSKDYVQAALDNQNKTPGGSKADAFKSNDAEYKAQQAAYDKAIKDNTYKDAAQRVKAESELAKSKVGSNFDKPTRDNYNLTPKELYTVAHADPNGNDLVKNAVAYGDALVAAGIETKNKYRDKHGNVNLKSPDQTAAVASARAARSSARAVNRGIHKNLAISKQAKNYYSGGKRSSGTSGGYKLPKLAGSKTGSSGSVKLSSYKVPKAQTISKSNILRRKLA